jgi:hypothetical protein
MAPFYLSSCRSFNVTDHPEATTESEAAPFYLAGIGHISIKENGL